MKCCFVFICQGGQLELESAILAASLVKNVKCENELVAAIPQYDGVASPSRTTLKFLESLGIRIEYIGNSIDKTYPIAHKIMSFNISSEAEKFIFLDSDMICIREIHQNFFNSSEFSARLTDFADLTSEEWDQIWDHACIDSKPLSYNSMASNEPIPMSFNSGVVITSRKAQLYDEWYHWALKLNSPQKLPKTRPFLDQIALSIAVSELNLKIELLTQKEHCSVPIFPIDVLDLPYLVHYYEFIHLLGDSFLSSYVEILKQEFQGLDIILKKDQHFKLL